MSMNRQASAVGPFLNPPNQHPAASSYEPRGTRQNTLTAPIQAIDIDNRISLERFINWEEDIKANIDEIQGKHLPDFDNTTKEITSIKYEHGVLLEELHEKLQFGRLALAELTFWLEAAQLDLPIAYNVNNSDNNENNTLSLYKPTSISWNDTILERESATSEVQGLVQRLQNELKSCEDFINDPKNRINTQSQTPLCVSLDQAILQRRQLRVAQSLKKDHQ